MSIYPGISLSLMNKKLILLELDLRKQEMVEASDITGGAGMDVG